MAKKHATTLSPMPKSPTNLKILPRPQKPLTPFVFSFLLFVLHQGSESRVSRTRIALLLRNLQAAAIPPNCRDTMPSSVHGGDS